MGPGVYVYEYLWHRWSRDFGLEASGQGKQESKFDGESKPLKKRSSLPGKARKQDFRRALRAQNQKGRHLSEKQESKIFPGRLSATFRRERGSGCTHDCNPQLATGTGQLQLYILLGSPYLCFTLLSTSGLPACLPVITIVKVITW